MRDHNGQQLAYVYFEDERGRRSAAKLLCFLTAGMPFWSGRDLRRQCFSWRLGCASTEVMREDRTTLGGGVLIILGNLAQQRIHLLCRTAFIWVMFLGQHRVARLHFCPEPPPLGFAVF